MRTDRWAHLTYEEAAAALDGNPVAILPLGTSSRTGRICR